MVRLRVDWLDAGVQGHTLVGHLAGYCYRFEVVGELEATRVTGSLDDLIGYLRSRLGED